MDSPERRISIAVHKREAAKGSRLQIFPGCSHLTMSEKRVAYVKALRDFLA